MAPLRNFREGLRVDVGSHVLGFGVDQFDVFGSAYFM